MSGTQTRRRYDRDFKVNAIRLITERGLKVAAVALDLGINISINSITMRTCSGDGNGNCPRNRRRHFQAKGIPTGRDEEIRQLHKELMDVREERDILKKAVAIFSKHQK